MTLLPLSAPRIEDFVPPYPHADCTRRRAARYRRARNHGRRQWLLALGRELRAQLRLDPPTDYDDMPF